MQSIEWRPVVGWEGLYEVSSIGTVRSRDRLVTHATGVTHRLKGVLLKWQIDKHGYAHVYPSRGAQQSRLAVHRMVALAFHGAPADGLEACHNNGHALDNRAVNIRWGTRASNMQDNVTHGKNHNAEKVRCVRGHIFTEENTIARRNGARNCLACRRLYDKARWAGMTIDQFLESQNQSAQGEP